MVLAAASLSRALTAVMSATLSFLILCILLAIAKLIWKRQASPAPYPPGPPADPLIGHARVFPQDNPHLGLMRMAKQYGVLQHILKFR